MSTYCSPPPLAFLFNENEIQNAYDYQQWRIKKKHLLCTQFSWVYCAMHNCNRGCIKLTRRGEKQSFSIPQKCSRKCAGNTTATHAMAREFMGHVWFGSCIILERFSSITIAMTCIWSSEKKVRFFIAFLDRRKKFCPKGSVKKPIM